MSAMDRQFRLLLIKPSHYDDDGYPISWWRAALPSNTLAVMNGLVRDCADRRILGPDVAITVDAFDETNRRIVPERLAKRLTRDGVRALVMLVGVQTNQFPRALDLAAGFRASGLPVVIGGFHVSGSLAMLPEPSAELHEAWKLGVSLFAGEAEEGRLDRVLIDAWEGKLEKLYDHLQQLPSLAGAPTPILPADAIQRTLGDWSSFDLGRGCPFQCSFCTIINVQGRKSRFRTADDLERIIRANHAQGIKAFFITDDNLVRNHDWESFFDRLIALREEGIAANLTIQVDTLCHREPRFIEKAVAAGVRRVFIGLENINPDNLSVVGKRQNRITEYRAMIQQWLSRGVCTFAGYIIGFPGDTPESVVRDIRIIQRELPIDVLEFFVLTPLPGSKDHQDLVRSGGVLDPDLNRYDLHHVVTSHPVMSGEQWREAYAAAWRTYYTYDHMEVVARRHASYPAGRPRKAAQYFAEFKLLYEIEGLHPLDGGILRMRRRSSRRPTMPRENVIEFLSGRLAEIATKSLAYARGFWRTRAIVRKVRNDPDRYAYVDIALTPPGEDEGDLAMFSETRGGSDAVGKARADGERARRAGLADPGDRPVMELSGLDGQQTGERQG